MSPSKGIYTEMNISLCIIQKHTREYDKNSIIISMMEITFFQLLGYISKYTPARLELRKRTKTK